MVNLIYPAIFEPCEEGGYCVTVPDLKGCSTEGDDLAEAIFMAVDAASGWVLSTLEDGNRPPEASNIADIEVPDGCFVNLIMLDMDSYAEKYGKNAVRKNCTIPAWLNTIAEHEGVNFSGILQEALINRLHLITPKAED